MNFKINLSILYNASEIALYTCFQKEVLSFSKGHASEKPAGF